MGTRNYVSNHYRMSSGSQAVDDTSNYRDGGIVGGGEWLGVATGYLIDGTEFEDNGRAVSMLVQQGYFRQEQDY
ncbi:hypothetical protein KCP69_10190 [Salmonella enterica subsp. enterica]|nr:hypothetical protein KCP69_10190 [Salmonella enterica subsp. enterica]